MASTKTLESKIDWPSLTPRRYGLTFETGNNKVIYPADSAFRGAVLASTKSQLKEEAQKFLNWVDSEKDFELLFDIETPIKTVVGYEGSGREKKPLFEKKELSEMSVSEYFNTLEYSIFQLDKSFIMSRRGGDSVFKAKKQGEKTQTHAGTIVLSGKVKSTTPGYKGHTPTFHNVSLTGPYDESSSPFSDAFSTSRDFATTSMKQGYTNIRVVDKYLGALLHLTETSPDKINNFENLQRLNKKIHFWNPIHTDKARKWKAKLPYVSEELSDLSILKHNILVDYYMRRGTSGWKSLFEIDKTLSKLPPIFDKKVGDHFKTGEASWEVIVNSYPFSHDRIGKFGKDIMNLHGGIKNNLKKSGYELSGFVLEYEGTPHESVAELYTNNSPVVYEVLWNKDFPPVIIERNINSKSVFTPWKKPKDTNHPFSNLYGDERTDIASFVMRNAPMRIMLPPAEAIRPFAKHYFEAIEEHNTGGYDTLKPLMEYHDPKDYSIFSRGIKSVLRTLNSARP